MHSNYLIWVTMLMIYCISFLDSFVVWEEWGPWTPCTQNCGFGKRSRKRKQKIDNVNIKDAVQIRNLNLEKEISLKDFVHVKTAVKDFSFR